MSSYYDEISARLAELTGTATAREVRAFLNEFDVRDIEAVRVSEGGGGAQANPAIKDPCVVAATDPLSSLSGLQTIDFYALQEGDRVLVLGGGDVGNEQNGIWVASSGAWTRATDADADGDFLQQGTIVAIGGNPNVFSLSIFLVFSDTPTWQPDVSVLGYSCIAGARAMLLSTPDAYNSAAVAMNAGAGTSIGVLILPTSDPGVLGALWNNAGTPTISAGPPP